MDNAMPSRKNKKKVALVELPDDSLDVLRHYSQSLEWEPAFIVSENPDSYAARMAKMLGVEIQSVPSRSELMGCSLIVIGSESAPHYASIREMMAGTDVEVKLVGDILNRLGSVHIQEEPDRSEPESGTEEWANTADAISGLFERSLLGRDTRKTESAASDTEEAGPQIVEIPEAEDEPLIDRAEPESETETEPVAEPEPEPEVASDVEWDQGQAMEMVRPDLPVHVEDATEEKAGDAAGGGIVDIAGTLDEQDFGGEEEEAMAADPKQEAPGENVVDLSGETESWEQALEDVEDTEAAPDPEPEEEEILEEDEEPVVSSEPELLVAGGSRPISTDPEGDPASIRLSHINREDTELIRLLDEVLSATGASSGSIMLLDGDGDHLGIAVSRGLSMDVVASSRPKLGEGLAGTAFRTGKPESFKGELPTLAETGGGRVHRLAASVPVMVENDVIGVINVNIESQEDLSTDETIETVRGFSEGVTGALRSALNIWSLDWDTKLEILLNHLDEVMAADMSFPERLKQFGGFMKTAINADFAHIFLTDPISKRMELISESEGISDLGGKYQPLDRGLFGWIAQEGRTRLITIPQEGSRSERAIACLNVKTGRPSGMIVLENFQIAPGDKQIVEDVLHTVVTQLEDIFQVEQGVETQDILSGLRMRIADRTKQLTSLPPTLRVQPALELAINTLAAEIGIWVPDSSGRPVITQPQSKEAARILAEVWENLDAVVSWIRNRGAVQWGATASREDSGAPHGPSPYVGVKDKASEAVLIVLYSSQDMTSPSTQLPFHLLGEVLYGICDVINMDQAENPPSSASISLGTNEILTGEEMRNRVDEEKKRSQRTGLPFALTRFEYVNLDSPSSHHKDFLGHFMLRNKRAVDYIAEVQPGIYVLLSPDTDPQSDGVRRRFYNCWEEQGSQLGLSISRCLYPYFDNDSDTTMVIGSRSEDSAA